MFYGRSELLDEVVTNFCAPEPHSYGLVGGRRFGKTSFLRAVECQLVQRLAEGKKPCVIPIYINLNYEAFESRGDFFACVIQHFQNVLQKHLSQVTIDHEILNQLRSQITTERNPLSPFERAFIYAWNTAFPRVGALQVALLVDESERILQHRWAPELCANLRAMLSDLPSIQDRLAVIMAGSTDFYVEIREEGSPLFNVLLKRFLTSLTEDETSALISEPTENAIAEDVVNEIVRQTGGHPFLTQYIMHYLWQYEPSKASISKVQEIVSQFPHERDDYQAWCKGIGRIGEQVYSLLSERGGWYHRSDVYESVEGDRTGLWKALEALAYHGLISEDVELGYSACVEMFRAWFKELKSPAARKVTKNRKKKREGEAMSYHDFELLITDTHTVRATSPQGQEVGQWHLEFDKVRPTLQRIEKRDTNEDMLKELGIEFYQALFPSPIDAHLRATEAVAMSADAKLRLRLRIEVDAIGSLPLEFTYRKSGGYFLAQNPNTVLSRYLDLPLPPGRIRRREGPLHMLAIIANPVDQHPLDPAEWKEIIEQSLAIPIGEGQMTLKTVTQATFDEIRNALLEQKPDIVQFVGHGVYEDGRGYLALVDDKTNRTWKVNDQGFANLFLGFDDKLGMVCLATCESAKSDSPQGFLGIAPRIVQRGVPAVMAMQYKVYVQTAQIFLENFYRSIAARKPVDWAVQWARNAVSIKMGLDNREFATPVLYMRAEDGEIFLSP